MVYLVIIFGVDKWVLKVCMLLDLEGSHTYFDSGSLVIRIDINEIDGWIYPKQIFTQSICILDNSVIY